MASAKSFEFDLNSLSVYSSCPKFSLSRDKVFIRPNPAFMPNTVFTCEVIELSAFHLPPFSCTEDQKLNALCLVCALRVYLDRTSSFRKSNQLFISWALSSPSGKPISKQHLSHWLVEAISLAYESKRLQPEGLRAHSTSGVAASWALFKGVSLQDMCATASWASPRTFFRYQLDVTRTPAHSDLVVSPLFSEVGCHFTFLKCIKVPSAVFLFCFVFVLF